MPARRGHSIGFTAVPSQLRDPRRKVRQQLGSANRIGPSRRSDHDVHRRRQRPGPLGSPPLFDPPPQTIAGHSRRLESRYNQPQSRVTRFACQPCYFDGSKPPPLALGQHPPKLRLAPKADDAAAETRQLPPCFDGMLIVSCLRPFLRRRDNVARPHRVAILARKPWRLSRLRFRGR
jgi:hypothetical protein